MALLGNSLQNSNSENQESSDLLYSPFLESFLLALYLGKEWENVKMGMRMNKYHMNYFIVKSINGMFPAVHILLTITQSHKLT